MTKFRIKEICQLKGISQKDLAQSVEISATSLSRIITCDQSPTLSTLEKISSALGVSLSELFEPPKGGVITCPNCGKPITLHPTCED